MHGPQLAAKVQISIPTLSFVGEGGTVLAIWDVLACGINNSGDFRQHSSGAARATVVVAAAARHKSSRNPTGPAWS